jgi:arginyl-tRNA synthetase
VITRDLRHAIARAVAAAGFPQGTDPGLRPTDSPGQYAASVALALGTKSPEQTAQAIAKTLAAEPWIAAAEVTGPGYLTLAVTPDALAAVADRVIAAGPDCARSDALAGQAVLAATAGDPLSAPTWARARAALAARLTARLAAAAGATVADLPYTERRVVPPGGGPLFASGETTRRSVEIEAAVTYAGRDAVTFTLARAIPGKALRVDPEVIARHVPCNPAYAVRYAHARASSGVRWATASPAADTIGAQEDWRLLDALSWLPERVATAARRGRPDEFARFLEDLASVTIDVLSLTGHPGKGAVPGSERLTLANAAQTGLAAGLSLIEVTAPERL